MELIKNFYIRRIADDIRKYVKENNSQLDYGAYDLEKYIIELENTIESYKTLIKWFNDNANLKYRYYQIEYGEAVYYLYNNDTDNHIELDSYLEKLYINDIVEPSTWKYEEL